MDLTDVWLDADEIDAAWFLYGEPALKDQYRDGTNEARAGSAQRILVADLYRNLADGMVIAIGFQIAPVVTGMPAVVPRHMFGNGPPTDWDSGKISASGLIFDRIKVLPAQKFSALAAIPKSDDTSALVSASSLKSPEERGPRREQNSEKPGPKSGADILMGRYELLFSIGVIPEDHTTKMAWSEVVKHLKTNPEKGFFKNGRGLSYPTFAKLFVDKT